MKTDTTHAQVISLIPWYANGTLAADERAAVEDHLRTCAACAQELHWLRNVGAAMSGLDEEVPTGDLSFAKAWAAVERAEKSQTAERSEAAKRPFLSGWLRRIWDPTAPTARLVFAAQLAVIVLLGVYVWTARKDSPTFTTLSGPEAPASSGARLTVSFAPNTSVEQMNQILTGVGGQIVSGPSALGMYVVQVNVPEKQDAKVQAVVEKLRANNAVRFVEREP